MKIIKKINTSAALALDSSGKEIVVLGKGIGFPQMPYELTDLSKIDRTFYDVDPRHLEIIDSLPQEVLMASSEIADLAEIELDCELNPNLPFTLADHVSFACKRLEKGFDLTMPIAYDVQHLYAKEYRIGVMALALFQEKAGIALPEHEAVNITMHLINAEAEAGDIHQLLQTMQIIEDINHIVESRLNIHLDKDSYNYSRYTTHLRYLIQRLSTGAQSETGGASMLRTLAREYRDIYICTLKVSDYLKNTWKWECNDEEKVYLMMHIHRVQEKNS